MSSYFPLELINELLAFRFGGEETALQSSFHIPPSFILFNLLTRTSHGFRSVAGKARAAFCEGAH